MSNAKMSRKRVARNTRPDPYREELVTFSRPDYALRDFRGTEQPCAFNGMVRVRRYRIVVELIDELDEVIHERLRKLWRETTNHHQLEPIKAEADRYGLTLEHADFGIDAKETP